MWLVVGLGNPGAKYERTRHNIGFRVVDELVRKHGLSWKAGGKLGAESASGSVTTERGRERCVVCKPMEFMNLSGFAVQRAAAFHAVDAVDILAVHDDVDLPFGVVRLKRGGGHGGHNGLRSMIEQLGTNEFARIRMGIGRDPNLPVGQRGAEGRQTTDTAGWVLGEFTPSQATIIEAMISAGCDDLEAVLAHGITPAMNQNNNRPSLAPVPKPTVI